MGNSLPRAVILALAIMISACSGSDPAAKADSDLSGGAEPGWQAAPPASAPSSVGPGPKDAGLNGATRLLDSQVLAGKGTFAPRDECGSIAGAREFRMELAAAVLRADVSAIADMALPDVRLGFGGDDGQARLRGKLSEDDGALIAELRELLALGCARDGNGGLVMPWIFAQDLGDSDPYAAMLVSGGAVPLLAGASPDSPPLRTLSWELVTLIGGQNPGARALKVRTADGATGFVPAGALRGVLEYRLLAVRRSGEWKIAAIVAGD